MGCSASFESADAKCISIFGSLAFQKCLCACLSREKENETPEEHIKNVVEEVKGMSRDSIEAIIETALRRAMTPVVQTRRIGDNVMDVLPSLPESPVASKELELIRQNLAVAGLI